MNSRLNRKINVARNKFSKKFNDKQKKEEMLISKISDKLGQSQKEVKSILSDGLMSLLTQVPFSVR